MIKIQLCLLDCTSIQRFVFGSNKLKTNIGASQIVEDIYIRNIPKALKDIELADVDLRFENWKNEEKIDVIEILSEKPSVLWETGYVGGGNALLLFKEKKRAKEFVKTWTRNLLLDAPGLKPAVAIIEEDIEEGVNDISNGIMDKLFAQLVRNKNMLIPETHILPHGITAECPVSGLSMESFIEKSEKRWISAIVKNKIEMSGEANVRLHEKYRDTLSMPSGKSYKFSDDSENLGQSHQEANHLGIVHIDGNSLGKAFKKCTGLIERRKLSIEVDDAVSASMTATIKALKEKLSVEDGSGLKNILQFKNNEDDRLPFRPIVVNGDDITFVCDARVSFFLAEIFMRAFASQKVALKDDKGNEIQKSLSSCAGIAIIKTKYPFYRGYMLAEQLCASAKEKGRKDDTSWIDFHISYRGLSESLEEMRKQQYEFDGRTLLNRPWQIASGTKKNSFDDFKKAMKALRDDEKTRWPRSKRHEFMNRLINGETATKEFLTVASARNLELPQLAQLKGAAASGWAGEYTPYFDILEIMDFYPECLL